MTQEKYKEIKEAYIEHITDLMTDMGGLYPHITIFADQKHPKKGDEDKPAIIHIPIPEQLMETDEGKYTFVKEILPELYHDLTKEFSPHGVAWSSEAWMRTVEKSDKVPDNWKDIPIKKEIIILTIDTLDEEDIMIYEVERSGKVVNKFGDLVDGIKLTYLEDLSKPDGMSGNFSQLFKKLNG